MAFSLAIVGLGMAVTPHAKSLLDLKDRASVAYAYSPSAERRQKFADRFAFPLVERLEPILEDRTVSAVLLLTPPNTHLELVERCAAAGKHILLEKPLEITYARAERLVAAARHVTLGIVLQHRFRPAAEKLHELLNAGKLGKLVSASASIPNWRPQSYYDQPGRGTRARDGGGVLLTQGIHTLDLLTWFAGETAAAKSYWTTTPVHRMETEDLACAAIRFQSGALGVVQATTSAYPGFPERIPLNLAFVFALIACVLVYLFLWRTKWGYEIRATGANPCAAAYGGISVKTGHRVSASGIRDWRIRRLPQSHRGRIHRLPDVRECEGCIPLVRQTRAFGLVRCAGGRKKLRSAALSVSKGTKVLLEPYTPALAHGLSPNGPIMCPKAPQRRVSLVLVTRTQVQPVSLQTRSSLAPGAP